MIIESEVFHLPGPGGKAALAGVVADYDREEPSGAALAP
jgi:hypothetical protein